jgi:hypothetical protein
VDEQGRLEITSSDGSSTECELEIPFSLPSLDELSFYRLAGEGHVFRTFDVDVFKQCKSATKLSIYFMRTYNLVDSLGESYFRQEVRAQRINQEIAPLIVRAFSHSIKFLENRPCPDAITYSRTADRVRQIYGPCHAALGGFDSAGGEVCIEKDYETRDTLGFAPAVRAEAEAIK